MFKQDLAKWFKATMIRAIKTFAETMSSIIILGMAIREVPWTYALSVSAVSSLLCILTCIKGLPEVENEEDNEQ